MNMHKELALQALISSRGDDLYRARSAFRNMTPEQMQEMHGSSGQTRLEILQMYEEHDSAVQAAIDWLRGLPE